MTSPSTTTCATAAANPQLQVAIAAMWAEADYFDACTQDWRKQLPVLMDWYGRDMVIESLLEAVPGLSMREMMTLADLAEREEGGTRQAAAS